MSISFLRLRLTDFRSTVSALDRLGWHWSQTIGTVLGCSGRGGRGSLHPVYLSDKQKHGEGNDDEVQNIVDEDAIIQRRCTGRFRRSDSGIFLAGEIDEKIRKIHPAQRQTNRRHKNIVDKRRHDFAKRRADNDGYCQINHISSSNELFELSEHNLSSLFAQPSSTMSPSDTLLSRVTLIGRRIHRVKQFIVSGLLGLCEYPEVGEQSFRWKRLPVSCSALWLRR